MSGRELDPDGTDSYHDDHPWEQSGHERYIDPSRRNRHNWPPVMGATPAGPHEAAQWGALPSGQAPYVEHSARCGRCAAWITGAYVVLNGWVLHEECAPVAAPIPEGSADK